MKFRTPLPSDNCVVLVTVTQQGILTEEIHLTPTESAWFRRVADLMNKETTIGVLAQ